MNTDILKKYFLAHQALWVISAVCVWLSLNILVLSTNYLMEARAQKLAVEIWQPFTWQLSSALTLLPLAAALIALMRRTFISYSIKQQIAFHVALTLPFSAIHVAGMVGLREWVYWLKGSDYQFGDWAFGFLYEYRKDFMTYISVVFLFHAYSTIVLRLQGEAKYVQTGEDEKETHEPEQFLVKKFGKEFLISIHDIEWVEASGNYANLHVNASVYPMRITMTKLEALLPQKQFFRIHRSYIVNLKHVKHIEPQDSGDHLLTLKSEISLNFSRRYREGFKEALNYADKNLQTNKADEIVAHTRSFYNQ